MTEDWVVRQLAEGWAEVPQTDLETVVALGRNARRRRRRLQSGGAALACVVVLGGGVAVAGAATGSHPAAIGPADQPSGPVSASLPSPTATATAAPTVLASTAPPTAVATAVAPTAFAGVQGEDPTGLAACAGGDTPAAAAVGRDVVAFSSSDYRNPAASEAAMAAAATGDLLADLRQQQPALAQAIASEQGVSTARVNQIGYINGDCGHPRYVVAVSVETAVAKQVSPTIRLNVFTASAVLVGGIYKLVALEPIAAIPPSAAAIP